MLGYLLIAGFASIFYYVGNNEYYNKGWLLAIISGVLSFVGIASPLGFFGALGTNLLLYIALFIYNFFSKKPPGSESGF